MLRIAAFALALLAAAPVSAQTCPTPVSLRFDVSDKIVRSSVGFTQGLEWRDGKLHESTGAVGGHSGLNIITPDGKVTNLLDQGTKVFGEGLTILNDEVFQLTWQDHQVFVYDLDGKLKRTLKNPREGWGLANDGTSLVFSDGSPSFFFADPQTFEIKRTVKLRTNRPGDIHGLNELEMVDGKLWGNIFQTLNIVRIDPTSGCIEAVADMGLLWRSMTDADKKQLTSEENVLNGIAYDKTTGRFFVTGKRWASIFVGTFTEQK